MTDIAMPQLGETVTEGTITRWFKQVGDHVAIDEMLFEVSTEKVDSEVPSPFAGVITEILVAEGETVEVGVVLAVLGEGAAAPVVESPPTQEPVAEVESVTTDPEPAEPVATGSIPGSGDADSRLLSPVVRRLIREHDLDPDSVVGTGIGGRITRKDVLDAIDARSQGAAAGPSSRPVESSPEPATPPSDTPPATSQPAAAPSPAPLVPVAATPPVAVEDGSTYVPFNNIRRRTAEHMVHTTAVAPHAMTVMEVDYERVDQARRAHKTAWKDEEGFSLTYLPFILRAVTDALVDWPHLNASVEGDGLRVHRDRNLGVAVDLDHEGLIVPVIRQADGLRMRALARKVDDLAKRARTRKLGVDDISGGTFTISNNGSFGTYTTLALINQPQVAVLSTDGVSRRPVVVTDGLGNESIAIHSVGNLAMGWDHRAFDGGYAAGFLGQVKEILQTRDWETEI